MPYSFAGNTAQYILSQAPVLLPCIAKAVAIYFDPQTRQLSASGFLQPRKGDIPDAIALSHPVTEEIRRLRTETNECAWFRRNEIPFEHKKSGESMIGMFSELGATILLMPVLNEYDGKMDLLYLYFPKDFMLFRMGSSRKELSTEQKSLIGTMLSNFVNGLTAQFSNDRKMLREINNATLTLMDRHRHLQEDYKRLAAGHNRNIMDVCRHFLDEIARGSGMHYTLSPQAVAKLKQFSGDIPTLKALLQKAVNLVSTMRFESFRDDGNLDEIVVDLCSSPLSTAPPDMSVPVTSSRMAKAMALLDRLEEAAQKVMENNESLTGANVGRACSKAITAAAITDALKTHESRIQILMEQYPDRWKLIREDFRPLQNVLSARLLADSNSNTGTG